MTDHPTPPLSDDELSAALDGEIDDALRQRIDASPEATARLAELRAAADQVRTAHVAPLDASAVDDLIATALDAPIAPARPARRHRGPAPWLVAAGVAVLMAIGLTLIWSGRSDQRDSASSAGSTAKTSQDEAATDAAADSSFSGHATGGVTSDDLNPEASAGAETGSGSTQTQSDSPATTVKADVAPVYLGTFANGDKLREKLGVDETRGWSASTGTYDTGAKVPTDTALDRCSDQLKVTLSLKDPPFRTGYATVDGKSVLVYEFASTSVIDKKTQTSLVAAVGEAACDQVIIFQR